MGYRVVGLSRGHSAIYQPGNIYIQEIFKYFNNFYDCTSEYLGLFIPSQRTDISNQRGSIYT